MRRSALVLAALVGLALPFTPTATAEPTVGLRASTLGLGVEASFGGPRLAGRVVLSALDYSVDEIDVSDIEYDGEVELRSIAALADFHPFAGTFRLTGGLVWNDHSVNGTASVAALLEDEGVEIPPIPGLDLGTLRGTAQPDSLGPWLGIGWGKTSESGGLGLTVDLGVVYLGDYDAELSVATDLPIDAIPGGRELLDALLEAEEAEIEAEIADEDVDLFPVLAIGVTYSF